MKKITVSTNALLNAVAVANTFMPTDGDYTSKLVMIGNDGKLQVKASNIVQTVIFKEIDFISSDLTDTDFSAFSIDGKRLLTVLKAAKTDEVIIELHKNLIYIKSARSKVKIETMANTQDITITTGKGTSFDISSQIGSLEQILHAVDNKNTKPELNGVLLQVENSLFNIVGTTGHRLAVISTETSLSDTNVIVPKDGIHTIVKLFNGFNISAELDDTSLSVHTDAVSYETKLINGKFPQWQKIVPQKIEQTITLDRYGFSVLLKEAALFDDSLTIRIKNGEILIKDFEGNTEVVDTIGDTQANIVFSIKAKVLLDFLASFDEDNLEIGFNGSNLPIVLTANPNYKEIVMPIVMQEEVETEEDQDVA